MDVQVFVYYLLIRPFWDLFHSFLAGLKLDLKLLILLPLPLQCYDYRYVSFHPN